MRYPNQVWCLIGSLILAVGYASGQARSSPDAKTLALGRRMYIMTNCHSCHGWYRIPHYRWGNLAKSAMVQADEGGSLLDPFLRTRTGCNPDQRIGMPVYPELSDTEAYALAAYVDFESKERGSGDAVAGEALFNGAGKCTGCHSTTSDLAAVGPKYDSASLRERLLPGAIARPDRFGKTTEVGLTAHRMLLQGRSAEDIRNLLTFLLQQERAPEPISPK